ncbi:MAG: hypothetical protein WD097_07160 [Balneolales bacterium]
MRRFASDLTGSDKHPMLQINKQVIVDMLQRLLAWDLIPRFHKATSGTPELRSQF